MFSSVILLISILSISPASPCTEQVSREEPQDQQDNLASLIIALSACVDKAPGIFQPLYTVVAQLIAYGLKNSDLLVNNFCFSNLTLPIPDMEGMTVKTGAQMQIQDLHCKMKEELEKRRKLGLTEQELPVIERIEEGKIGQAIIEWLDMVLMIIKGGKYMAVTMQYSLEEDNPYRAQVKSYAMDLREILNDQTIWDDSHDTLMCMYDAVADEDKPEVVDILNMFSPRIELESQSKNCTKIFTPFSNLPSLQT